MVPYFVASLNTLLRRSPLVPDLSPEPVGWAERPDRPVLDAWPAVIALSGLPFAGKSTLARAVAGAQRRTLLEIDRLIDHAAVPAGEPVPDRAWIAAYREADALLRGELATGHRVVYDGVNFRWVQREKLRRVAGEFGQRVLVVHVTTPIGDNLGRQRANAARPTCPAVDAGTFAMVRKRFEPPREREWAVEYDGSEPVGPWLARVGAALAGQEDG